MKNYIKRFVNEDEGIETIEFIGMVAVAALLVAIVASIGTSMKQKAVDAQTAADNLISSAFADLSG